MYCWVVAFSALGWSHRRPSPEASKEFRHICRCAGFVRDEMVCLSRCNIFCVVAVSLPPNRWCVTNQVLEVIRELVLFKKKGYVMERHWLRGSLELQSRQSGDVEPLFGAGITFGTFAMFITVNKKNNEFTIETGLVSRFRVELLHSSKCLDERQQLALVS